MNSQFNTTWSLQVLEHMQPSRLQEHTHKRSDSDKLMHCSKWPQLQRGQLCTQVLQGRDPEGAFQKKTPPRCINGFHIPKLVVHVYAPSKPGHAVRVFLVGFHLCRRNELCSAQEIFKPQSARGRMGANLKPFLLWQKLRIKFSRWSGYRFLPSSPCTGQVDGQVGKIFIGINVPSSLLFQWQKLC